MCFPACWDESVLSCFKRPSPSLALAHSGALNRYAANVHLLSPQLIKIESSFDLSGTILVGSGPAARRHMAGRRKDAQKSGESGDYMKEGTGRWKTGFMEVMEE